MALTSVTVAIEALLVDNDEKAAQDTIEIAQLASASGPSGP